MMDTDDITDYPVLCVYCDQRQATQLDHLFHKALRRRFPLWNSVVVAACEQCNMRRFTHRLLPQSWAERRQEIMDLTMLYWWIWDGGELPADLGRRRWKD